MARPFRKLSWFIAPTNELQQTNRLMILFDSLLLLFSFVGFSASFQVSKFARNLFEWIGFAAFSMLFMNRIRLMVNPSEEDPVFACCESLPKRLQRSFAGFLSFMAFNFLSVFFLINQLGFSDTPSDWNFESWNEGYYQSIDPKVIVFCFSFLVDWLLRWPLGSEKVINAVDQLSKLECSSASISKKFRWFGASGHERKPLLFSNRNQAGGVNGNHSQGDSVVSSATHGSAAYSDGNRPGTPESQRRSIYMPATPAKDGSDTEDEEEQGGDGLNQSSLADAPYNFS